MARVVYMLWFCRSVKCYMGQQNSVYWKFKLSFILLLKGRLLALTAARIWSKTEGWLKQISNGCSWSICGLHSLGYQKMWNNLCKIRDYGFLLSLHNLCMWLNSASLGTEYGLLNHSLYFFFSMAYTNSPPQACPVARLWPRLLNHVCALFICHVGVMDLPKKPFRTCEQVLCCLHSLQWQIKYRMYMLY